MCKFLCFFAPTIQDYSKSFSGVFSLCALSSLPSLLLLLIVHRRSMREEGKRGEWGPEEAFEKGPKREEESLEGKRSRKREEEGENNLSSLSLSLSLFP
jgi:hypothetical protein